MPRSIIQIHLFRIYVRHHVARLHTSIDYPVTGVVVVPKDVRDVNAYMQQREVTLAQLRLTQVLVREPSYGDTVAAMMFSADIRQSMGLQPPMPPDGLVHGQTAASCEACRIIGLCDRSTRDYLELRTKLEDISRRVTKSDPDFCQALDLRLNTYAV
jgi:hypothetical protein